MADPALPPVPAQTPESSGSWLLPGLVGLGSFAAGVGLGRAPGGDPSLFMQPLQTMSLLDYRNALGQHYRDLSAYQQAEHERKQQEFAQQQQERVLTRHREEERLKLSRQEAERQQAAEQRNQYWDALMRQQAGLAGVGGSPSVPPFAGEPTTEQPAGLPPAPGPNPAFFQPPGTAPQLEGDVKKTFSLSKEGPRITVEPTQDALNRQTAVRLATQDVMGKSPADIKGAYDKYYRILSNVQAQDPSKMQIQEQYAGKSLQMLNQFETASKEYLMARDAWRKMINSYINLDPKLPGPSDMTFIYGFVTIQDPRSVVRGEEADAMRKLAAAYPQFKVYLQRVLAGESVVLPPEIRQGLVAEAERVYQARLASQASLQQQFDATGNKIAQRFGVAPLPVTIDYIGEDKAYLKGKRPQYKRSTLPPLPSYETAAQAPVAPPETDAQRARREQYERSKQQKVSP